MNQLIKALLVVFYSYDKKSLHENNLIENLNSVKKLMDLWSARGLSLSLYGKVI